jgi:serine/threonine-protein kinase RsbW
MDITHGTEVYNKVIKNDPGQAVAEVKTILNKLKEMSAIDNEKYFDIKVILCELIQNAIKHGNTLDGSKKISIEVHFKKSSKILKITIKDEGRGFNPFKTLALEYSRIDAAPLDMSESGRGLVIVQKLSDNIEFNSIGNVITVTKRL